MGQGCTIGQSIAYYVIIYATADEADAYMFYRCFFSVFCLFFVLFFVFFPSAENMTTVLENG